MPMSSRYLPRCCVCRCVVTNNILDQLKRGVRPWIQPWSETSALNVAVNASTGNAYRGINRLLLYQVHGQHAQPRFMTIKQADKLGGRVREGEHGYMVVYVGDATRKPESPAEEPETYRFLKYSTVFNVSQIIGLPDRITALPAGPNKDQRDRQLQEFIDLVGARVEERVTANEAFYSPSRDLIVTPAFQTFVSLLSYQLVLFHELIHWTGHASRLDRFAKLVQRFDTRADTVEELVAELGAAFLCAEFSIDGVAQAATYVERYVDLLTDDPRAIFTAASKAQEAVDFLRQRLLADSMADAVSASSTNPTDTIKRRAA
jgi:antirestriction protein ArdC